jgi:hypothetical protein
MLLRRLGSAFGLTSTPAGARPVDWAGHGARARVRVRQLNENSDDDFEARTELNQPAGGLPVLIAN